MNFFLTLAFLFFIGSISGWCIEVIFRKFFSSANPERKWINPGFLIGPYLPLYGFSLCVLYLLASCESFILIENDALRHGVLFVIMALTVTLVEFLAGLIFIKGMKVKLWDYSSQWGNIMGIICPKFTFFWAVLSAVYYFLIHPRILGALEWLSQNLAFSFIIGMFFGVFIIDFVYSSKLLTQITHFCKENGIIVRFEELKATVRRAEEKSANKARFFLSICSKSPISVHLKEYAANRKDFVEKIKNRKKKDGGKTTQ